MAQARVLRDIVTGTVLDVIPATELDICSAAVDLFERKSFMRWLKKRKADEPSVIIVRWEGKMRFATLGTDVEYVAAVPTAPPRRPDPEPTAAPRDDVPEWAKLKE